MSPLENAADSTRGPGPWFTAQLEGNCSRCGDDIVPGGRIRADGWGSWECCDEDDAERILAAPMERFSGTSDEEMGY